MSTVNNKLFILKADFYKMDKKLILKYNHQINKLYSQHFPSFKLYFQVKRFKDEIMFVDDIKYENGNLISGSASIHFTDLLKQTGKPEIQVSKASTGFAQRDKYVTNSFSVHFVKLHVHPVTGVINLKHIVSVADAGKIISEKTKEFYFGKHE